MPIDEGQLNYLEGYNPYQIEPAVSDNTAVYNPNKAVFEEFDALPEETQEAIVLERIRRAKELKRAEQIAYERQRQGTITAAPPEPSFIEQTLATLARPMTAMMQGTTDPNNLRYGEQNNFDMAIGMVNPFSWIEGIRDAGNSAADLVTGDGSLGDVANVGFGILDIWGPGKLVGKVGKKMYRSPAAGAAMGAMIDPKGFTKGVRNMYNAADVGQIPATWRANYANAPGSLPNKVRTANAQTKQFIEEDYIPGLKAKPEFTPKGNPDMPSVSKYIQKKTGLRPGADPMVEDYAKRGNYGPAGMFPEEVDYITKLQLGYYNPRRLFNSLNPVHEGDITGLVYSRGDGGTMKDIMRQVQSDFDRLPPGGMMRERSLSTDSYPLVFSAAQRFGDKIDIGFTGGYNRMNDWGEYGRKIESKLMNSPDAPLDLKDLRNQIARETHADLVKRANTKMKRARDKGVTGLDGKIPEPKLVANNNGELEIFLPEITATKAGDLPVASNRNKIIDKISEERQALRQEQSAVRQDYNAAKKEFDDNITDATKAYKEEMAQIARVEEIYKKRPASPSRQTQLDRLEIAKERAKRNYEAAARKEFTEKTGKSYTDSRKLRRELADRHNEITPQLDALKAHRKDLTKMDKWDPQFVPSYYTSPGAFRNMGQEAFLNSMLPSYVNRFRKPLSGMPLGQPVFDADRIRAAFRPAYPNMAFTDYQFGNRVGPDFFNSIMTPTPVRSNPSGGLKFNFGYGGFIGDINNYAVPMPAQNFYW